MVFRSKHLAAVAMGAILLLGTTDTRAHTQIEAGLEWGLIAESYEPNGAGPGAMGLGQVLRIAQSTGDLYVLELDLGRRPGTIEPIVVELREGTPNGPLLATSEPVEASEVPSDPAHDWVAFHFMTPLPVQVGDEVAIVMPPGTGTGDPATGYSWYGADETIVGDAPWLAPTAGWIYSSASGSWEVRDPVLHRTLRMAVSVRIACSVFFARSSVTGVDIGPSISWPVGRTLEFLTWNFIPLSTAVVSMTHVDSGRTREIRTATDFLGQGSAVHAFGPADEGHWTVAGGHGDGRPCGQNPTSSYIDVQPAVEVAPAPPSGGGSLPNTAVPHP